MPTRNKGIPGKVKEPWGAMAATVFGIIVIVITIWFFYFDSLKEKVMYCELGGGTYSIIPAGCHDNMGNKIRMNKNE